VAILIRKSQPVKKSKHRELQITALIIVVFECHGLRRQEYDWKLTFLTWSSSSVTEPTRKKKKKKKN
jgi:hypothetical protein